MNNITLGYAFCGSFCTIKKSLEALRELSKLDINIIPIMSETVYTTDTRFGNSADLIKTVKDLCKNEIIHTIKAAEPIGPKGLLDALIVAPSTGNTLAKMVWGITDTSVTMAIKAHLRNEKPVILGIASNDALGTGAKNIGLLSNQKNIYFVPYSQDDPNGKHNSLVCDFTLIPETLEYALKGKQLQPVLK